MSHEPKILFIDDILMITISSNDIEPISKKRVIDCYNENTINMEKDLKNEQEE